MRSIYIFIITILFVGCGSEELPKPKGYLSLDYPEKSYKKIDSERPYVFEISKKSFERDLPKNWLKIEYPELKAAVHVTYRPVENNNLKELLMEAEKLVFEHTVKADQISSKDFQDFDKNIYGKLYEISGNAASQVQFHVTDSSKHFIKGSLFFYSKPNYDSILPAVNYIKKDMVKIIETLEWKKQKR